MFGNNYLEEFQNASMQLEEAKRFWTEAIITMDPFARKLKLSQYDSFVWVLSEELDKYKRQNEPGFGIPLKLPPDLQKKANTLEAISSALKIIREAIRDEDFEGEYYLDRLPIPSDLNSLYTKRFSQIREDFPSPFIDEDIEDEDDSFELIWNIKEFYKLLNKAFELESKYFFLVKKIGVYLLVRDTDFKEIKNRDNQFLIYANGLNDEKLGDLVENQPKEYQKEYDALRSKSDEFYLGDVCEWFYISKKLLNEVKGKYNSGYQEVKIKIGPLQYDKTQFGKEELKSLEEGNPLCHNRAIKYGGPCPITPFKTNITLSYLDMLENETESDLIDSNDNFELHIGPKTAKKIIENSEKNIPSKIPPVEEKTSSWSSFYSEFEGVFDEEESLGIELIDSDESRKLLEKLGYVKSSLKELDCSKIGEYFPTSSDDFKDLTIIIFHKLPLDFDYEKGNDFVKKWFGLYKKYIRSLDPYTIEEEDIEDQDSEKLRSLKEFTQDRFKTNAKEWLIDLVERTKKRTYGHYEAKPDEFWWDPKEVEDWEFECAAALTNSSINAYNLEGKEAATKTLAEYFANTTLIGEEQSTKIHMLLLHASMIGFENYLFYDRDLGEKESKKLTDEIVLKAFNIDPN